MTTTLLTGNIYIPLYIAVLITVKKCYLVAVKGVVIMLKFKAICTNGVKLKDGTERIKLTVKLISNYSTEAFEVIQFPNTSINDTIEEFVDYLYDLYDTIVNYTNGIEPYEEWCYVRGNTPEDADSLKAYTEEISDFAKYCKVMGRKVKFDQ